MELTTRKGHSRGNKYAVEMFKTAGVGLAINNDAHTPEDILEPKELKGYRAFLRPGPG